MVHFAFALRREDELRTALSDIEQVGHNPADLAPDLVGLPDRHERLCERLAGMANAALHPPMERLEIKPEDTTRG